MSQFAAKQILDTKNLHKLVEQCLSSDKETRETGKLKFLIFSRIRKDFNLYKFIHSFF
jgi:hypothetical protein